MKELILIVVTAIIAVALITWLWHVPPGSDYYKAIIDRYGRDKFRNRWKLSPVFDLDIWNSVVDYKSYQNLLTSLKHPSEELVLFNDKIWLHKWLERQNLFGPEIVFTATTVESLRDYLETMTLKSFCVKPSHLSETQGTIIVKKGKLLSNVKTQFLENVPRFFDKFKKGYTVSHIEIIQAMEFIMGTSATWEDAAQQQVSPGIVVEKLRPTSDEYKIFVALGDVVGLYHIGSRGFTDMYKGGIFQLAENAAIAAGIDFVRVDIFFDSSGNPRISEFTWNPIWAQGFEGVISWHRKRLSSAVTGHYPS